MEQQQRQKKKSSLINRAEMKKYILAQAEVVRPGWKFTQVSKDALDQIEAFVRNKVRESVGRAPSIGKTYKSFY